MEVYKLLIKLYETIDLLLNLAEDQLYYFLLCIMSEITLLSVVAPSYRYSPIAGGGLITNLYIFPQISIS